LREHRSADGETSTMNPKRNAKREGHEATLQYRTHQETLGIDEVTEEKLAQLHSFIEQLRKTPPGALEFKRRTRLFGECNRMDGEAVGQFYGRLRHWLDRDLPSSKSPRQASRHMDE
jgi:hypothetical protein